MKKNLIFSRYGMRSRTTITLTFVTVRVQRKRDGEGRYEARGEPHGHCGKETVSR